MQLLLQRYRQRHLEGASATAAQAQPPSAITQTVIEQLKALWSPEQIAGRLLADGVSAVRVCTETIYRFIYSKEDYALEL
ncbi:hypothetical protein GOB19_31010, partial [Sinorhizobium meliloti]|nr:hypothetical protein [Sinorhizobium meliloti]